MRSGLTPRRVELIRTSGFTDAYWARLWRKPRGQIRKARIGETYVDHPTPPDTRPRDPTGRRKAVKHAAIREHARRSYFKGR